MSRLIRRSRSRCRYILSPGILFGASVRCMKEYGTHIVVEGLALLASSHILIFDQLDIHGRLHQRLFTYLSMQCRPQLCKSASRQLLWTSRESSQSQIS